nr:unnamed protein product [Digitaria exilis]
MPLGFSGTYRDLVGGNRELANVALGRRQMAHAVDTLAAHTTASGGCYSVVAAHRYVLAGKSAVFLRQLIGHREGKKTTPVEVKDMDAATFRAMVHYIYTDTVPEFDDRRRRTPEEDEALDRLKLICKRKLQSGAIYVDMAARTLALAEQHGYRRLKAKCIDFTVGTPETLHAVLATEGYKHLEASCPSVLTELLKSVHGRKNQLLK